MARSLNKATLIGNLTADPELRYTPQGTAVCNFSVATNRTWKNSSGEVQDEATFHRIIAWSKLAEICAQILAKGRKVYIAGRIANRNWEDKEGQKHYVTEIVAEDLIALDSRKREAQVTDVGGEPEPPEPEPEKVAEPKGGEK